MPLDFGTVEVLPQSGNQDEEYVQISNPNPYEVDISGWEMKRGVEHTFEPGTVIRANEVMYVAGKTSAFRNRTTAPSGGQQLFVQGGFKGTLSARGEIVELWDPGNPANPTDDRLVAPTSPLSNVGTIARTFLPLGARVIPLATDAAKDYKKAGHDADVRLEALRWPLDLVWLGVGADGHTASIFAGPDMDDALNAPKARRAVGVLPDPLPAEAPVARVTLTRHSILSARTLLMVLTGADKRALVEQAIKDGPLSPLPVGRVLADAEQAFDIHWCA